MKGSAVVSAVAPVALITPDDLASMRGRLPMYHRWHGADDPRTRELADAIREVERFHDICDNLDVFSPETRLLLIGLFRPLLFVQVRSASRQVRRARRPVSDGSGRLGVTP